MPDVSYARSGDVAIAYQVFDDGPGDRGLKGVSGEWRLYAVQSA